MNIFSNMFGSGGGGNPSASGEGTGTSQAPNGNANPDSPNTNGAQPMPGNPDGKGNSTNQGNPPAQKSPLDSWAALYDTSNNQSENTPQSLRIPQDKLREVSGNMDFAQSVPPELISKFQSGDMSAFSEIMNTVGRQIYSTAMEHATGVTDHHLTSRFESERKASNKQARVSTVDSQLNVSDLPQVAQGMFRDTAGRIASQNPNLSAKEVEEQTWTIMQEFSNQFNRTGKQQSQQQKAQEIDYDRLGGFANES